MRHILVSVCLLLLAFSQSTSADIARLEAVDPLTLPSPENTLAEIEASSTKAPKDKIAEPLKAQVEKWDPDEVVEVIITLTAPSYVTGPLATDDERGRRLAALAHRFAAHADELSLSDLEALSHFPVVKAAIPAGMIDELAARAEVDFVEPNLPVEATRVEGKGLIQSEPLRTALGGAGQGVNVAVYDTGVDDSHAELVGRVTAEGNFTSDPGDGTVDGQGHGTSVGGIIAGTNGVAPLSLIWAVKVLDSTGSGKTWDIEQALNQAYVQRNDFGGLDIVNMSLGTPNQVFADFCDNLFPSYSMLVSQLWDAGVVIFAASGNDGRTDGITVPACLEKTIAVGAVHDANIGSHGTNVCVDPTTAADQIACYSNSAGNLDILAPASCATTTTAPGGGYDNCFAGTSAATPYAAAVAAQILSIRPQTTPLEILTALFLTGRPIQDVNGVTRNRINALQAYEFLAAGNGGGGDTSPCIDGPATLCLNNDRFEIKVTWRTNNGSSGVGRREELTKDTGYFWFFNSSNVEMVIKVLNACPVNNRFWVFAGGLTNVEARIEVRDTESGEVREYQNPANTPFLPIQDTDAFATCN